MNIPLDLVRTTMREFGIWKPIGKSLRNIIFDEADDDNYVIYYLSLSGIPKENIVVEILENNILSVTACRDIYKTKIYNNVDLNSAFVKYSNGELSIRFDKIKISSRRLTIN
jgi:HSP20 family molecular chaperone IbpA